MSLYSYISLGNNESGLIAVIEAQHEAMRGFERGTVDPTVKVVGQYFTKTDHSTLGEALMRWNGSAWTLFADPEATQINNQGTVAMAANLPMGTHKLTGLSAGSGAGDSVRYEQVLLLAGGTMTGNIAMGGHGITGLPAPSATGQAARWDETEPVSGAVTGPVSGGTVTVTLGFRPRRVTLKLLNTYYVTGAGASVASSSTSCDYYFTGGVGVTEAGICAWHDYGNDKLYAYVLNVTTTGTGFTVQGGALFAGIVGLVSVSATMQYAAYR